MDKIQNDIYTTTINYANKNNISITDESNLLIRYAIVESLSKLQGLDKKLNEIAKNFYDETLIYYVKDEEGSTDQTVIDYIRGVIDQGIEEYKKVF